MGEPFGSVLYPGSVDAPSGSDVPEPDYFHDLNLDQVELAICTGRERFDLAPYLRARLTDIDPVRYRQDVFRDVERDDVRAELVEFAKQMSATRRIREQAGKTRDVQPKRRLFLSVVDTYCGAVAALASGLCRHDVRSAGLIGLRDYLAKYVDGPQFAELRDDTARSLKELADVRYDMLIRGTKITVGPFDDEADYSAQVLATFERFRQGEVKDHHGRLKTSKWMDHVEVAILDLVARLHQEVFERLGRFCERYERFADATVLRADRELQFYLGYLEYVEPMRRAGLVLTYPTVSTTSKSICARDTFDIALASKLVADDAQVVANDFHLDGVERILVVSGPNQGGKTTLARTFGQLSHLAALGCPVPGTEANLFLADRIFSHFEREEDIETLAGKLEDELNRMRAILEAATPDSLLVLNEIFNSTTVQDAAVLSSRILEQISELDALAVCVTFIDELSRLNDKTVSVVSTVDPDDPAVRTFRLMRKPADGRAYAIAIAQKYRLTYDALRERIA